MRPIFPLHYRSVIPTAIPPRSFPSLLAPPRTIERYFYSSPQILSTYSLPRVSASHVRHRPPTLYNKTRPRITQMTASFSPKGRMHGYEELNQAR